MINFNIEKIKFIKKENGHTIFCIENFLNQENYKNIKNNLPNINISEIVPGFFVNNKLGISPTDGNYENLILKNDILARLHYSFYNTNFLKLIFKKFYKYILYSRKNDFSYLIKILLRKNRFLLIPRKKNFIQKLIFNDIYFLLFNILICIINLKLSHTQILEVN